MSMEVKVSRWLRQVRGGLFGNDAGPVISVEAYNDSGGALARGDVVILDRVDSTADLYYVTTTALADHPDVFGMVMDASIASAVVGNIQIYGPTSFLKVDGTDNIADGDLLGTYAAVKIAAKTYGAAAFAIAQEAYSTDDSAGVIDAFLLGNGRIPRLHGVTTAGDRSVKVAKVALAAVDTTGGLLSWANPEGTAIAIVRLEIDRTTATSAACTGDFGTTATDSTTSSDNLIDGLDMNATADLGSNQDNAGSNGKGDQRLASGKWLTGSVETGGASAGLVGSAYIHYIVL